MQKSILSLFTRTPLHIGAGSSVGAIDQPIVRERHTRFPVIPGSSLKGVISDLWEPEDDVREPEDDRKRTGEAHWLFGSEDSNNASAGAVLFGEGKLLAFPVRSAKGAFAWVTCPLALSRYKREAQADYDIPVVTGEDCFAAGGVTRDGKVILEEYVFPVQGVPSGDIVSSMAVVADDAVWENVADKLVIIADEAFSYFAEYACETPQHIRIDDATGTVADRALFNQENVPSETLFYAVIHTQTGKRGQRQPRKGKDGP